MKKISKAGGAVWLVAVIAVFALLTVKMHAENKVLGEVEFAGATNIEQDSGVWVDGQYLGYLKELKGSKKVLLLPGTHTIQVKHDAYTDFTQEVTVQPGGKQVLQVELVRDPRYRMPAVTAEIKLSVDPDRAAVFVDGELVGHAGELGGIGKSLLVARGSGRSPSAFRDTGRSRPKLTWRQIRNST